MTTSAGSGRQGLCRGLGPEGRCSRPQSPLGHPQAGHFHPLPCSSAGLRSSEVWRRIWSKNLVLLANMPPQVGQATTFSWVWLRRCSRSLQWSLKVQVQPGEDGRMVRLQPQPADAAHAP